MIATGKVLRAHVSAASAKGGRTVRLALSPQDDQLMSQDTRTIG
jgi:hypothetical protein